MEETSYEALPDDLQTEILSRLPLKSLVQCICVSKKLASLIRTKAFRDLYLRRSLTRPRLLFINFPFGRDVLIHSVYQEKEPLCSSGHQRILISLDPRCEISQPILGLICIQENTKVVIFNPGTKKSVALPEIQAHKNVVVARFFGYDESTDVFKVLCIIQFGDGKRSKDYQVFTMKVESGEESNSWRVITCKHDHSPVTEGLCKGGFLYYGADESNTDKDVVVSFNVSSEEFSVIELPEEVKIDHRWRLVNYNGEVALVDDSEFDFGIVKEPNGNGVFELWVRNETDGTWWRNCIEIPHWKQHVGNMEFFFKGTIGTGELVFAQDSVIEGSFYVVYYDTVTQNLRRFTIEGEARDQLHDVRTFLDHVDSTWLM